MAARKIIVLGLPENLPQLPDEEWKSIPSFDGYAASNQGRIASLDRRIRCVNRHGNREWRFYCGKILSPGRQSSGHLHVQIGKGSYDYSGENVHVLVALAFIGPRPSPNHEVAHWDGNPENNYLSNLRYATYEEQHQDQVRHGRAQRGEKHYAARLTEETVREIRRSKGETNTSLARKYGVNPTTIFQIRNYLSWRWLDGDDSARNL